MKCHACNNVAVYHCIVKITGAQIVHRDYCQSCTAQLGRGIERVTKSYNDVGAIHDWLEVERC